MILVHDIKIENYYSIGNITYNVVNGVLKLSGTNGVGKTSFCSALSQGLYNKSIKNSGTLIEDTYNKVTKKPYTISINLTSNGINYLIVNDRTKNNIFIYKEGIEITPKSIKAQLQLVQNIIGVDYDTFISLTYLSQTSMNSVFDLSDTNNILHKFFDIDMIIFLEKNLKLEKRDLTKQHTFITSQKDDLERTIQSLDKYSLIDVNSMYTEREAKSSQLTKIVNGVDTNRIKDLRDNISNTQESLSNSKEPIVALSTEINLLTKQRDSIKGGKCPVCNSNTTNMVSNYDKSISDLNTTVYAKVSNLVPYDGSKIFLAFKSDSKPIEHKSAYKILSFLILK